MTRKPKTLTEDPAKTLIRMVSRTNVMRGDRRYVEIRSGGPGTPPTYFLKAGGYTRIETLAREGRDIATIAASLGITNNTFHALRRRDEAAQEALDRGRAILGDEITDLLLEQARGGNTTAAIFLGKARLHWRDVGPVPGEASAPKVNITINAPMTDEQFSSMITVEAGND